MSMDGARAMSVCACNLDEIVARKGSVSFWGNGTVSEVCENVKQKTKITKCKKKKKMS